MMMLCVGFEVHKFSEPPPLRVAQQIFQSPPFGCLKIFGVPPPQYLHPPLVILNELSLRFLLCIYCGSIYHNEMLIIINQKKLDKCKRKYFLNAKLLCPPSISPGFIFSLKFLSLFVPAGLVSLIQKLILEMIFPGCQLFLINMENGYHIGVNMSGNILNYQGKVWDIKKMNNTIKQELVTVLLFQHTILFYTV